MPACLEAARALSRGKKLKLGTQPVVWKVEGKEEQANVPLTQSQPEAQLSDYCKQHTNKCRCIHCAQCICVVLAQSLSAPIPSNIELESAEVINP